MTDWLTAAAMADERLPGLPSTRQGVAKLAATLGWGRAEWERVHWRQRAGRGGGIEYAASVLPEAARAELLRRRAMAPAPAAGTKPDEPGAGEHGSGRADLWTWWRQQPVSLQARGRERAAIVWRVAALEATGICASAATAQIAHAEGIAVGTLWRWRRDVEGWRQDDWPAVLTPKGGWSGRPKAACDEHAWEMLRSLWLLASRPSFEMCLRRVQAKATEAGWAMPSARTLRRRIEALPAAVVTAARDGAEALRAAYPAQQRTRAHMHALYGVNADGHRFDVFVRWDDGTVARPVMVAFQDLYSGMMLGYRVDRTECAALVRLALGDVFERHGIPDRVWLDNGRGFASKWITGGTPNRYRFKVREEDPAGILTMLGCEVHWTTPYAGQSKPIERAFLDLTDSVARHPAFDGAYTGRSPMAKPANYGRAAIPIAEFKRVLAGEIEEHNARRGRRAEVCGGERSFREAFEASYAETPIRRATEEQRRLWLLAAEAVRVRRPSGCFHLLGNRFWHEALLEHLDEAITARFDPHNVHAGVDVLGRDGRWICRAEVLEAAGFDDVDAAREQARKRRAFMRAAKAQLATERTLTPADLAAMLVRAPPSDAPEPAVIRPLFGHAPPIAAGPPRGDELPDEPEGEVLFLEALRHARLGAETPT